MLNMVTEKILFIEKVKWIKVFLYNGILQLTNNAENLHTLVTRNDVCAVELQV